MAAIVASHLPLRMGPRVKRLADSFATTVSGEEVAHGKPAPDIYLAAARNLEVAPARSVAVEDSTNGLRAAAAAGMFVVALPNRDFPPTTDALALAGLTLHSLDELTPRLLELSVRATAGSRSAAG